MIASIFRQLPAFKGKQRLARLLLSHAIQNKKDSIIEGKYGCRYKVPNLKESIGFELYINGIYEQEIVDFIRNKIPPNGIMIDLGANIGAISIPVATLRKDIKILGIEASPRVFKFLEYNMQVNKVSNCTIFNNAIADSDGALVNFYSPEEKFGKGSLSNVFTEQAEIVSTIRIDSLCRQNNIPRADFIKADIEGYEYHAFKSGEQLLRKPDAPDILFEFVDWAEDAANETKAGDAQQLLLDYGYKLFKLQDNVLLALTRPMNNGSAMIFATKK